MDSLRKDNFKDIVIFIIYKNNSIFLVNLIAISWKKFMIKEMDFHKNLLVNSLNFFINLIN